MKRLLLSCFFLLSLSGAFAQGWKLTRQSEGMRIYQSENSGFKNIRVEATLPGTLDRLQGVLYNVGNFKNWVYGNKTAHHVKQVSPTEYYYYSETALPWPLSNRDAVVHARVQRDGDRSLHITETSAAGLVPEQAGKVRVRKSTISWTATPAAAPGQIYIVYIFEAEPGGKLPAWLVNNFAEKGPYESFKKLAALLK
ncbi:START domain-containing protein [Flaviaesturariibacter amylovorans]|uniref:START domain-containing protein n=1 Tax=Flaviaesturariibacter amylovorans TaxID=1084520 RepID=A0ABP8G632_9BACT